MIQPGLETTALRHCKTSQPCVSSPRNGGFAIWVADRPVALEIRHPSGAIFAAAVRPLYGRSRG